MAVCESLQLGRWNRFKWAFNCSSRSAITG